MNAKQTMRQGRRLPLKHCLLPMASLLLTALAALLPHSAPAGEPMRIRLIVDGETLPAVLEDNPAGRDFLSMLPLTLTVKDYNGTEKIGNPPRVISTEDMPDSIEPSAGDLTFYAPWGNIAIFYREFRLSRGLVRFGRITSGIEKLAAMRGDFSIAFERAE